MTGPLFIIIAAILWALDGVLRRSLYTLPAITIVFLEHLVGLLLLTPLIRPSLRYFWSLTRKDKGWMLWVSLCSSVLGTLWFTSALLAVNFIPFSVVFLLQKLQPVFVIATAALILREPVGRGYWRWALLALGAAYFVTFPTGSVNLSTGDGTLRAALYALAAAFAWGTSTVFSRLILTKVPDKNVTTLRFLFATVFAAVLLIGLGQGSSLAMVTPMHLSRFVIIALSTGMVALALYYRGLARTPAKIATILELVFPLTAVLIDAYVYQSVLTPLQYGAAMILVFAAYKLATLTKTDARFVTKKITGKGRGKFLGYPTINLIIPPDLKAQDGIYAARIAIGKKSFFGALHYGPIPTYADSKKSLEVFLLDAKEKDVPNSMLATAKISVEFVKWLRPVIKFDSEAALIAQISKDVEQVRKILA